LAVSFALKAGAGNRAQPLARRHVGGRGTGKLVPACDRRPLLQVVAGPRSLGWEIPAMNAQTRRYSIEIRDVATERCMLLTAADWTRFELHVAIARIMRLAGFPDDNGLTGEAERGQTGS
jgi:hypothetical protein